MSGNMSPSATPPERRDDPPSTVVVETVAAAEGVDTIDLPPLYEWIDPDALDEFVADEADDPRRVRFDYAGYEVTVEGDGAVSVEKV
ncbi:HalOD1 output domain-containing protein [Halorussus halophilus]|uniref:HalOD1 output domain-containing protein n=1 Tax=Halorussus halophilus TaxID=2650975 RepID=UPI001CE42501|nr:HalOD1 output domain-containing protein [Halorussus halophilus]